MDKLAKTVIKLLQASWGILQTVMLISSRHQWSMRLMISFASDLKHPSRYTQCLKTLTWEAGLNEAKLLKH